MQAGNALGVAVEWRQVNIRQDRLPFAAPPDGVIAPSLQGDELTGANDVQVDLRAADRDRGGRLGRRVGMQDLAVSGADRGCGQTIRPNQLRTALATKDGALGFLIGAVWTKDRHGWVPSSIVSKSRARVPYLMAFSEVALMLLLVRIWSNSNMTVWARAVSPEVRS